MGLFGWAPDYPDPNDYLASGLAAPSACARAGGSAAPSLAVRRQRPAPWAQAARGAGFVALQRDLNASPRSTRWCSPASRSCRQPGRCPRQFGLVPGLRGDRQQVTVTLPGGRALSRAGRVTRSRYSSGAGRGDRRPRAGDQPRRLRADAARARRPGGRQPGAAGGQQPGGDPRLRCAVRARPPAACAVPHLPGQAAARRSWHLRADAAPRSQGPGVVPSRHGRARADRDADRGRRRGAPRHARGAAPRRLGGPGGPGSSR